MLVLSRKTDESIVIDETVNIVVLSVRGGRVRLGIEAPKEVQIQRRELITNGNQLNPPTTRLPSRVE